jgi:hypothetical protein
MVPRGGMFFTVKGEKKSQTYNLKTIPEFENLAFRNLLLRH